MRIEVERHSLFNDLLTKYETFISCNCELRVKFKEEKGVGAGVCRDMFSAFWERAEAKLFEGNTAKVPVLTPDSTSYFQLGRILSHGYILTGYLPLFCAKAFFISLLPTVQTVESEIIMESFLDYIDEPEAEAVKKCLQSASGDPVPEFEAIVIPMLARFNYHQIPLISNLNDALLKVASYTLICQPYFAMLEMQRGMVSAHSELWKKCSKDVIVQAYAMLVPTADRVLKMIVEPQFNNSLERTVFDYLRRFLLSLSEEDLCKFLRFVTGNPHCGMHSIKIAFHSSDSEYTRRPTVRTCSRELSLPLTSPTYTLFSKEFKNILDNNFLWSFDFI